MYKDSSCRSSPQPPPTALTAVAADEDDDDAETTTALAITTIVEAQATSTAPTTARTTPSSNFNIDIEQDFLSGPSESSSDSEYEVHSRPSTTSTSSTNSSAGVSSLATTACRSPNTATTTEQTRPSRKFITAEGGHSANAHADVRLLRKIGYIASRVRILAKFYGDFKLPNPYSPNKQRKLLQDIIEHHSIIDPDRDLAKTEKKRITHCPTLLALAAEKEKEEKEKLKQQQQQQIPTDQQILLEELDEDFEDEESNTTTTVRRKSSAISVSASIVVLEDLLIQFYEDHRNKVTVIRQRRHHQRHTQQHQRRFSTNGIQPSACKFTKATVHSPNRQPTEHIMSSKTAVNSSSSVERLLQSSTSPTGGDTDAENAYNNAKAVAAVAHFFHANSQQQQQQQSSQPQPAKPQHRGSIFLQPVVTSDDNNPRRRRASDCSATHLAGQPLANQLQVTLKNNNCTTAKFPYHRGSCGATGEHFLAANSIANRSTIILSKSCSNVDGSGVAVVDKSAAALYSNNDLRNAGVIGGGNGNGNGNGNGGGGGVSGMSTGTAGVGTPSGHHHHHHNHASNGNNEYSVVQLNNTIIQCHFNDDDFRALVKDLKRKVEYTERMNWLCLSKRPMGPPHRKSSIPKHQEVKKRFLEICDSTFSDEVKAALRLPAFDSYEWADADVIHLMQTMFFELGFMDKFNIPPETLREWLYEVYKHYNEVPFHNFRHCFCVAQMMYAITRQANLLQRLGDLECLILLVSCICHDLDHPGYNNIYQINARTELALRYNDISPLENHHCSIAFRLLEHPECNIFKNFSRETFNQIREGIIRCILATDMARHNEILTQFKEITPVFDYSNRSHINLLCMILIKVADISNEARPMDVAEPWLDRLLQEFFAQSAAEKSEGLPVTPFMDPDKVSKPGSQVRFIGLVLLPLFEALGDLVPELIELIIIPVRVALDYYKRLNDAQTRTRKSVADSANSENTSGTSDSVVGGQTQTGATSGATGSSMTSGSTSPQMPRSQSGISVKSRRSIPSQKSASRTSVDEPQGMPAELHDLPEGSESGDSETATEVDVAEKTSKFKVDTEGNASNRSKSSHSTSRKSSREKRPSMVGEICSSGGGQRMRNSYGNIHGYPTNRSHFGSNRAVSLDQYSTNNRRLSDGLQQVISDSNVFYNRQNAAHGAGGAVGIVASSLSGAPSPRLGEDMNMNAMATVTQQPAAGQFTQMQNVPNTENNSSSSSAGGVQLIPTLTNASSNGVCQLGNLSQLQQGSSTNGNVQTPAQSTTTTSFSTQQPATAQEAATVLGASNGLAAATTSNKTTWKSRLKQFSDYFSFSFDKNSKRYGSTRSSPCSLRNNNATNMQHVAAVTSGGNAGGNTGTGLIDPSTGKPGICCTISNSLQSPGFLHKQHQELLNAGRHRAYSLDVPPCSRSNPRYSSSSGGGGDGSSSRKSSRLDGVGGSITGEENNSQNTLHSSSGAGSDMPSCMPPPIRIGSVDASDALVFVTGVPRVVTPGQSQEGVAEHRTSLSIDLSCSATAGEQPKI